MTSLEFFSRLALLITLSACAAPSMSPPSAPLREETPKHWQALEAEAARSRPMDAHQAWWRDFGDEHLSRFVDEALIYNHDLRAALERIEAARALAVRSGADALPQINLGADAARSRRVLSGFPGGSRVNTDDSFALSIGAGWELDLWGRIASEEAAALSDVETAKAAYRAAQLSLVADLVDLWFRNQEALRRIEVAQKTLLAFRETESVVRARVESELTAPLDLDLAQSNRADAEALLASESAIQQELKRRLEILAGRYPAGSLVVETGRKLQELPDIPVGAPGDLLERRWDLVASRERIAAAGFRVAAAKAAMLPTIRLTGEAGFASEELADLTDPSFNIWNLAAGLVQPIFQGGRLKAEVRRQESIERELGEQYASILLNAFREVETALTNEGQRQSERTALYRSYRSAARATEAAALQYEEGLVDIITWLDAQRRQLRAESAWVSAQRSLLSNRVALYRALGGGFGARD